MEEEQQPTEAEQQATEVALSALLSCWPPARSVSFGQSPEAACVLQQHPEGMVRIAIDPANSDTGMMKNFPPLSGAMFANLGNN